MNHEENIEPAYYAVIPTAILERRDLHSSAKLVYAEITTLMRKKGYCYATNEYIAERIGIDKRNITRIVKVLIKHGLLHSEIERSSKGTYRKLYLGGYTPMYRGGIHGLPPIIDNNKQNYKQVAKATRPIKGLKRKKTMDDDIVPVDEDGYEDTTGFKKRPKKTRDPEAAAINSWYQNLLRQEYNKPYVLAGYHMIKKAMDRHKMNSKQMREHLQQWLDTARDEKMAVNLFMALAPATLNKFLADE